MPRAKHSRSSIPLRATVICPHCWHRFPPEDSLWVSQHPDLLGDERLGESQPRRFLPTRFTVDGAALDSRGFACHDLACPHCHLSVPRALLEMNPFFISILGAPACGKSYFLAAMTWRLRQLLPRDFALSFADVDPVPNQRLQEYEELQFLNPDPDALVAIEKTQTQGDLYDTVLFGEQTVTYPKPFLFSLRPLDKHPNFSASDRLSRALCVYDNAGESFLPGADVAASPVTRHLALSSVLFFLFDPTQDARFRQACRGKTDDPQMQERRQRLERERPVRQETVLLEAAERVRRYAGLGQHDRHDKPLVVVVTKYDCWASLLSGKRLPDPWGRPENAPVCGLRLESIQGTSDQVRELLASLAPELVSAAEGFAENVTYIPISALGRSPEVDPETGAWGARPKDVDPMWPEVPLLYTLGRWTQAMMPVLRPLSGNGQAPVHSNPLRRSRTG